MTPISAILLTTINKYATSKDEMRYYLCGVCLDISEDGKAYMVATDGWKMLAAPFDNSGIPAGRYTIPRKLIENIKPKKNDKSTVDVSIDGNEVALTFNGATFIGKLIDGTFPDWRRVFPETQNGEPARFSGSHLKDIEDAGKAVGAIRSVVGFNGWNPSWVEFIGSKLFGIVMPVIPRENPDPKKPEIN